MDFLQGFKTCFLDVYIFAPFICAIIIGALICLKNPIHIRCLVKIFFTIQFFFSSFLLLGVEETRFSILGLEFLFDKVSSIFLFFLSFILLMFLYFSKTFIKNMHRLFYSVFILLYGILNVIILCDNISFSFLNVFWLMLLLYFLSETFSKNKERKKIKYQLFFDVFWFILALGFISWDFIRYFILNHIDFNFSNVPNNLYHINDDSILIAFVGFLIMSFKFLNFLPFDGKTIKNSEFLNPFVSILNNVIGLFVGMILLIKTYLMFNYLFYQEQEKIAVFLLINLLYFLCLTLRKDNILRLSFAIVPVLVISEIFTLFLFNDAGMSAFLAGCLVILVSVTFFYFVVSFLISKMNTLDIDEFKKIPHTSRNVRFFVVLSILNLAKVPFLSMFTVFLISFSLIFSTNYDSLILNCSPYILLFANFALSINLFNLIYKILIEPQENSKDVIAFSNHQMIPLILCGFCVLVFVFYFQSFFAQFAEFINLEGF